MRFLLGFVVALAVLGGRGPVAAQPAQPADPGLDVDVDLDGDGDVDADDRALLGEVIEVKGKDAGRALVESARAVTLIDTKQARERTADLGEVLSRAQGIQVRRSGGLGSATRFSLNGLYDEQIRFFLDGVPLHLAGWGGVADVPVELVERVEVHRGVVPIALGADALGGAIDLVSDREFRDRVAASYQLGSFGTERVSATARGRHASGGVAGLTLFVDRATNDYPIDVEIPDERGQLHPATVRRFHDGYLARGGNLELGVVDQGVLRRGLFRLHLTDSDKELQHNAVMTVPYGEVTYGELSHGIGGELELAGKAWSGRALAGIARRRVDFQDLADVVYDWNGDVVRERRQVGEIGAEPIDQVIEEVGAFARITAELDLAPGQQLRFALAPTAALREGTDYTDPNPEGRDPLDARRDLYQVVTGVEHQLTLGADDELENIGFAKHYAAWTKAEDVRAGYVFVPISETTQRFGIGDAARWRLRPWLMLKASYEWATRLPSVDEVFGDGILVQPNLELAPEVSHNGNLGAHVQGDGVYGAVGGELNLFARLADDLILLLGDDRYFTHQNVWRARILGVESTVGWVAPGEWASLEASATLQDIRNASGEGTFGAFDGDRIPNRPWLLAAASGSTRRRGLISAGDEATVFASSRYVHEFFRGWESLGVRESKQVVASQLVHGVGASYALRGPHGKVVTAIELHNLTDARVFDSFGVQRPGRALFVKMTGEI